MMQFVFLFIAAGFWLGCQTSTVYDTQKSQGQWEAKAQIKDFKNNKQHQVSLDFLAQWPHQLRTDVTGPLGISLAALVLKKDQVAYLLPREKKYFYGSLSDESLAPLFQIELNPKYLLNICFDQVLDEKGWTCSRDSRGLAEQCYRASDKLTIVWKEREGEKKRVLIHRPDFEVQILFKKFKPLVQVPEQAFALKPPDDFTRFQLQ